MFELVEEVKMRWHAWNGLGDMSRDEASRRFVRIVTAADHFDARYKKLTSQVHKIEAAWRMDPSHIAKDGKVMEGIWNVSQSRYFEREKLRAITLNTSS